MNLTPVAIEVIATFAILRLFNCLIDIFKK